MVLHIPVYQIILLNDPEEILNIGIRNTYFLVYDTDRFDLPQINCRVQLRIQRYNSIFIGCTFRRTQFDLCAVFHDQGRTIQHLVIDRQPFQQLLISSAKSFVIISRQIIDQIDIFVCNLPFYLRRIDLDTEHIKHLIS